MTEKTENDTKTDLPSPHSFPPDLIENMAKALMVGHKALALRTDLLIEREKEKCKNPAKVLSERARKIRRALRMQEKPPENMQESLFEQARMLDVLFRQLMLDSTETEAFDERFGLALALRAQSQYRQAIQTLDKICRQTQR